MQRLVSSSTKFFSRQTSTNLLKRPFSSTTTTIGQTSVAAQLKTRSVIRIAGPDSVAFLQGLLTNDVRVLDAPATAPQNATTPNMPAEVSPTVYAALLTSQGRFLYDFFLYRPPKPDEKLDRTGSGPGPDEPCSEILADVDGSVLDELIATLNKYRLKSKVDIENVSSDFVCWQRFGGEIEDKKSSNSTSESEPIGWGGTVDQSGVSSSQGNTSGWHWSKDPRLACLGFRGIFPSNVTPPLVEADTEADEGNYLLWRLENGVAEGSIEIPKGEAIPLEYNLAGLNAINFEKGCYVGQELIARTHHRGVVRKRLIPLRFVGEDGQEISQRVSPGSEVIRRGASEEKSVGTVTTACGPRGLGLIRLDEAFKGRDRLGVKGVEYVRVESVRPEWWPGEWFAAADNHSQQEEAA